LQDGAKVQLAGQHKGEGAKGEKPDAASDTSVAPVPASAEQPSAKPDQPQDKQDAPAGVPPNSPGAEKKHHHKQEQQN
jgi:hypothetical protein